MVDQLEAGLVEAEVGAVRPAVLDARRVLGELAGGRRISPSGPPVAFTGFAPVRTE
jgi:hypothetical protein